MKIPQGSKQPSILQALSIIAGPIKFLETCSQRYGDTFTLRLLGINSPPVVFFSNPQAIMRIFYADADKFELGEVTDVFLPLTGSQSLITLKGEKHQSMRNIVLPPLHGKAIQSYSQLIVQLTEEAIASWPLGSLISIRESMTEISLDIILRVVFGINPGKRYNQLKKLIYSFLEYVNSPLNSLQFFWSPLQQNLGKWSPWGKFIEQRQQIDDLIYAEIASRRYNSQGNDILSLLLQARDEEGKSLTDDQLRDQLITLLLLGHETTASALSWAFYWIHKNPQVLTRLQQELDQSGSDPLKNPYLNAVCQESLRIYPIALISQPRFVKQTVEIDGYQYQPGTILVPCIYLAHRRPEVYPQPEKFLPERFLDNKFSPYEYFPFGGGSRSCIGMALSMLEMKLILATVLSRYQLALPEKNNVRPIRRGITIVPSGGCQMIVSRKISISSSSVASIYD